MEILYVDSQSNDKNLNMNNFYNDNYIMLKRQKKNTMCGFFLNNTDVNNTYVVGLCILVKGVDFIQIVVLNIENKIQNEIINYFIEHIFNFIKNTNYNTIKIINSGGLLSLNRYIYGANVIKYNIYNEKYEISEEEVINIEKNNIKEKTQHRLDKYQIIYLKNKNSSCELSCCCR
jgi:hypothetical protein